MSKEQEFLKDLGALFTGAKVEGESGFINLMQIKNAYFLQISKQLEKQINKEDPGTFREEMFEKLAAFFSRYFCESGSVYFRHIPAYYPALEKVYANGEDVQIVWKTSGLYYVKSDYLTQSIPVEFQEESSNYRFWFDASAIENKKNNERKNFVFEYSGKKPENENNIAVIKVLYQAKGKTTKHDDILKEMKEDGFRYNEETLVRAFNVFKRQSEVDFFIHKNAGKFLHEQFDFWMYQYMFKEESDFSEERMAQLRILRNVTKNIIDFIAQFEDELVRVWQKPKFVRNANYVITLNKLSSKILQNIAKHKGMKSQIKEWCSLGLTPADFSLSNAIKIGGGGGKTCTRIYRW